jgi:hypothetical protein
MREIDVWIVVVRINILFISQYFIPQSFKCKRWKNVFQDLSISEYDSEVKRKRCCLKVVWYATLLGD